MFRRLVLGLVVLACLASRVAHAQGPDDEARALFEKGLSAADAHHWAEAVDYFERSRELVERPSTLFNLVGALYRLGRYREGLEVGAVYLRTSDPEADRARRIEVEDFLSEMQLAVAVLTLSVEPQAAEVRVDGRPIALREGVGSTALDPGRHVLEASAQGHEAVRESVTVERSERVSRRLALPPISLAVTDSEPRSVERAPVTPLREDTPSTTRQKRVRRALWITGSVLLVGGIAGLIVATLPEDERPEPTGGTTGITLSLGD